MGVTSACRECLKNIYKIAFDWKLLIQKNGFNFMGTVMAHGVMVDQVEYATWSSAIIETQFFYLHSQC